MPLGRKLESINRRVWYPLIGAALGNRDVPAPLDPSTVRSILLLRYDAVGDMVLTTPAIDLLRRHLPDASIDVVASPRNVTLVDRDPRFRHVYVYPGGGAEAFKLARILRPNRYDVVFGFVTSKMTKLGFLANAIGGRRAVKVTQRHDDRSSLYSALFNLQLPPRSASRSAAANLATMVADTFGLPLDVAGVRLTLNLPDENLARARRFHDTLTPSPFIVLNISSNDTYRRWSTERNAALVTAILARHPELRILVTSSPGDRDEAAELAALDPARVIVTPLTSDLLDVAAILEGAAIVITPDTSLVHLASAMDVPTVALYSRLTPRYHEWLPTGISYEAVVSNGLTPIETIQPEEVMTAFDRLLAHAANRDHLTPSARLD